jgi:hypothetical protein
LELKDSNKHKIQSKENIFSIDIHKCNVSDHGIYRVCISNGTDHIEQTTILNIKGTQDLILIFHTTKHQSYFFIVRPRVEAAEMSNEQSCIINEDTQISWRFSGIEKPQVAWLFNGQSLPINERFQITETDDGISTLSIRATELYDGGIYTARAINSVGQVEATTKLNINGIQPMIINGLEGTLGVIRDESMIMKLNVTGIPKPGVIWLRDSCKLVPPF